jgi:hypothetical protein
MTIYPMRFKAWVSIDCAIALLIQPVLIAKSNRDMQFQSRRITRFTGLRTWNDTNIQIKGKFNFMRCAFMVLCSRFIGIESRLCR